MMMRNVPSIVLIVLLSSHLAAQKPSPGLRRYVVVPQKSVVGFDGKSTLHDFTGKSNAVDGELRFDPADPAMTAGGRISLSVSSLDTADKERDVEMRKRFEVEKHPTIEFSLDALVKRPGADAAAVDARGRFRIHGVERERTIPGTLEIEPQGGLHVKGELKFKMTDHLIEPPVVAIITVDDEVRVFADLIFAPVKETPIDAEVVDIDVKEIEEPTVGEKKERTRREHLFIVGEKLFWSRDGSPLMAIFADRARILDSKTATIGEPTAPCDAAFKDALTSLDGLKKKLAALPENRRATVGQKLSDSIARLEKSAALAPAVGDAEVKRDGADATVRLGAVDWIVAKDIAGGKKFFTLAAVAVGLPAAVRAAMQKIDGLPRRLTVRTVTTAGSRTVEMTLSAPREATMPDWLVDPSAWTHDEKEPISW